MIKDLRPLLPSTYLPIGNSKLSFDTSEKLLQPAEVLFLGTNALGDPLHTEYIISQNYLRSKRSAPSLAQ